MKREVVEKVGQLVGYDVSHFPPVDSLIKHNVYSWIDVVFDGFLSSPRWNRFSHSFPSLTLETWPACHGLATHQSVMDTHWTQLHVFEGKHTTLGLPACKQLAGLARPKGRGMQWRTAHTLQGWLAWYSRASSRVAWGRHLEV